MDFKRRFGGLDRLYGEGFSPFLAECTQAMVVGVGGVGSWAVEALARSGVGRLVLVDLDHVAESNMNRQIQACDPTLGQEKIRALADRIASYAPHCEVIQIDAFLDESNAQALLSTLVAHHRSSIVLDCCDNARAKVALALCCRRLKLPFWMAGSAGGKVQPWLVQPADLRDTTNDPLLAKIRYQLRREHGFSQEAKKKMGVPVFYSNEQVRRGNVCDAQAGLNCAGYGSLVSVTATMGMQMAASAIQHWAKLYSECSSSQ
jgi:tRNA A37 threonylcarbamoyladenosine dehydratase